MPHENNAYVAPNGDPLTFSKIDPPERYDMNQLSRAPSGLLHVDSQCDAACRHNFHSHQNTKGSTMITYIKGDATQPIGDGPKVIAHICNDKGKWGAGFVLALSKRNMEPEIYYRRWAKDGLNVVTPFRLGEIQLAPFSLHTMVANMIAQQGFGEDGKPPIRYLWLTACLVKLRKAIYHTNASVHMPRIGCGLAGGEWPLVEALVDKFLAGIPVTVYDL